MSSYKQDGRRQATGKHLSAEDGTFRWVLPSTRKEKLLIYQNGKPTTAYSATSAPMFAHAAIRPFLLSEDELKCAPELCCKKAIGKGLELQLQDAVSALDCTGAATVRRCACEELW